MNYIGTVIKQCKAENTALFIVNESSKLGISSDTYL